MTNDIKVYFLDIDHDDYLLLQALRYTECKLTLYNSLAACEFIPADELKCWMDLFSDILGCYTEETLRRLIWQAWQNRGPRPLEAPKPDPVDIDSVIDRGLQHGLFIRGEATKFIFTGRDITTYLCYNSGEFQIDVPDVLTHFRQKLDRRLIEKIDTIKIDFHYDQPQQ